jgi:hypothetical protein
LRRKPSFPALEAERQAGRGFLGIRGFFLSSTLLCGKITPFFGFGPRERLRSLGETATYGANSAVDSAGAAMSAFQGRDG